MSRILVLLCCCAFFGCSMAAVPTSVPMESAIAIDIEDSVVVEDQLNVRARVRALTSLPTKTLSLTLRGLKNGETLRETTVHAATISPSDTLREGEAIIFQFAIDATDITEFQVAGEWGTADVANIEAPLSITETSISSEPSHCHAPPCDMLYSIAGLLQNNTDTPIQGIVLDLGLDWVERGQSLPAHGSKSDGQQIELNAIVIPSRGSRRFLFTFDRTVPELPSGRFVPRIGVIRAEPVPSESPQ